MAEKNKETRDARSALQIILVLSALCVVSISFSAPYFGNQKNLPEYLMIHATTLLILNTPSTGILRALHAVTSWLVGFTLRK